MKAPQNTPSSPVYKGFVPVDGKLVHFVRQGQGPALVMLHAAPCSAKVMAPLQAVWAPYFTTFAFDLPGFGLSDPIEGDPIETAQIADRVAGAIRALGLTKVALYGRHTGAGVCVEIARRHPDLAAFVLTDGYPVFATRYDESKLANYLPPIVPAWDGSHLTWCWYRYREQHMFWPWDKATLASRADTDVPNIDFLYRGALEMLEARASYAKTYASAFRHPGLAVIDEVKAPVCYGNRPGDSQFKTMKLYPPHAWVKEFSRDHDAATAEELVVLREHGTGGAQAPAYQSRFAGKDATVRDYIDTPKGAVYARGYGLNNKGTPLIYLPELPGGVDLHIDEMKNLAAKRPVVGFDFFGNGNSTLDAEESVSIDMYVDQLREVLSALGWSRVDLYANGTSSVVAVAFAKRYPELAGKVVLRSPLLIDVSETFAQTYAPDIRPEHSGGNFLKLWHHLRDQELWWPWYEQRIGNARKAEPRLDPEWLTERAIVLLRQPAHYQPVWAMVLGVNLAAELVALKQPSLIVARDNDLFGFANPGAAVDIAASDAFSRIESWLG